MYHLHFHQQCTTLPVFVIYCLFGNRHFDRCEVIISVWLWFAFSWYLVKLNIFSCAWWRLCVFGNTYWGPLPNLNWGFSVFFFFFLISSCMCSLYIARYYRLQISSIHWAAFMLCTWFSSPCKGFLVRCSPICPFLLLFTCLRRHSQKNNAKIHVKVHTACFLLEFYGFRSYKSLIHGFGVVVFSFSLVSRYFWFPFWFLQWSIGCLVAYCCR